MMTHDAHTNGMDAAQERSGPEDPPADIALLYTWFERFNDRFFDGALPKPQLRLKALKSGCYGWYVPPGESEDAPEEIVLRADTMTGALAHQLAGLLHMMVHQWQWRHGKPHRKGYHNREFCDKSRTIGIPCNQDHYRKPSWSYGMQKFTCRCGQATCWSEDDVRATCGVCGGYLDRVPG